MLNKSLGKKNMKLTEINENETHLVGGGSSPDISQYVEIIEQTNPIKRKSKKKPQEHTHP